MDDIDISYLDCLLAVTVCWEVYLDWPFGLH